MSLDLKFYWKLLLRRLPAMMVLFILCTAVGLALALRLPTTYETQARLLVQGAQIDPGLAQSTVNTAATEEIEILKQRLLTRASLIDIANDFDVFEDRTRAPDEVVEDMREATTIRSEGGVVDRRTGPQPALVTITFRARSGQIAADVVNEYVTRITNTSVQIRTDKAEGTLDFFEQEVDRLNTELDLRSARISQFQSENANALPDNQDYRLGRQSLLQERLASADRERDGLIEQRTRVVQVFEATGTIGGAGGQTQLTPDQRQLQALEAELAGALTVYSDTNPKVTALKSQIAQLQARVGASAGTEDENPNNALLNLTLAEIDSRIEGLNEEVGGIRTELAVLEDNISQTPLNAIALQGLERDYENIRIQYDRAVQQLSLARTGERIELTGQGQRISLIEAASVPNEPASPNRPLIAIGGAAMGLALAAGLFLLMEILNRSVRRPAEVIKGLGITPLATVPYIESRGRRIMRRSTRVLAMLIVLTGVPAALWAVDQYYLPLDLLAERIWNRLGIV